MQDGSSGILQFGPGSWDAVVLSEKAESKLQGQKI